MPTSALRTYRVMHDARQSDVFEWIQPLKSLLSDPLLSAGKQVGLYDVISYGENMYSCVGRVCSF